MILLLDNRDSFTFNIAHALEELGAKVRVARSTELPLAAALDPAPAGIVIGPGPGTPRGAGISEALIRAAGEIPLLGICLGHQALATAFGGRLRQAHELVHGETRSVHHDGEGLFQGLPSPLHLARYNSLVVDEQNLPADLEVCARDEAGEVAALRHRERPFEGLQSHPESALCLENGGRRILANFLERCG